MRRLCQWSELPKIGSCRISLRKTVKVRKTPPTEFCAPWANGTHGKVKRSLVIPRTDVFARSESALDVDFASRNFLFLS
jgi:hypothetical protein